MTIDLFKSGSPTSLTATSIGPGPALACGDIAPPQAPAGNVNKNRFLSIIPPRCSAPTAIRVRMTDLQSPDPPNAGSYPPPNFSAFESGACTASGETNGCARWIGKPFTYLEKVDLPDSGSFRAARLQCTPHYQDWSLESVIHAFGAEILPSSTYSVQLLGSGCTESSESNYSPALVVKTARHGDIHPSFQQTCAESGCTPCTASCRDQPEGPDTAACVNKFKNMPSAPIKVFSQLIRDVLDLNTDVEALDITLIVDAFKGFAYSQHGPCPCPSTVTCGATVCPPTSNCNDGTGGGMCVRTCASGGPRAGQRCMGNEHCGECAGGTRKGFPCDAGNDCPASTCTTGTCNSQATCFDRCGRCSP